MKKEHIDDVQTQTVDEHFKFLLEDNSTIDPEATDVTPNDLPDWYNEKLYKEAQNYYRRNILSITTSGVIGLIIVFSVETILKVLLFTKRSNSVCSSFNRYIETILHMVNLHVCDSNDADSKWYKSMNTIRWLHKINTRRTKEADIGEILQRDMVLTQYAFAAFIYIAPRSFGLHNTLEEDEAFNHFWRVNGYMLGISDKFNLCRRNAKETTELCQKIKDLYVTYLRNASPEFHFVASNATKAMWYINMTTDKDAVLAFCYQLHGLPYNKKLGWYSWLSSKYIEWQLYLCLVPYVGAIVRIFNYYFFQISLWSLENFPLLGWMKFGKANVRINLYPKH